MEKKRNVFAVLCRKRHVQSGKKVDCDESVIVIATSFFSPLMSVRSPSAYTLFIYTGYIPYRNISLIRLYLFAIDAESLTMYMYTDKYTARARVTNFLGGGKDAVFSARSLHDALLQLFSVPLVPSRRPPPTPQSVPHPLLAFYRIESIRFRIKSINAESRVIIIVIHI